MMLWRALIADDEELGRLAVRRQLERDGRFEICAEFGDGLSALEALAAGEFDVAFLDINMPGLDGLELASRLEEERPFLIFVTAHEEHALKAFGRAAVDYVVKPIEAERFRQALDRVCRRVEESRSTRENAEAGEVGHPEERVTIRQGGVTMVFRPAEVILIEASGNYVGIVLEGSSEPRRLRLTLKGLLDEIGSPKVMRVHRAFAVGIAHARELRTTDGSHSSELIMNHGARVPVGRTYRSELVERLRLS